MDSTTVFEQMHSFYSESFTNLMYLTIAILTIIGIVMPLIIQWIQTRNFKIERETLEGIIQNNVDNIKEEMIELVNKKFTEEKVSLKMLFEEKSKKINDELKQLDCNSKGNAFFLQASIDTGDESFGKAALNYFVSANYFLKSGDSQNAQNAISNALEFCLSKLNNDKDNDISEIETEIDRTLKLLGDNNSNSVNSNLIKDIKKALKEAKAKILKI